MNHGDFRFVPNVLVATKEECVYGTVNNLRAKELIERAGRLLRTIVERIEG